MVSSITITITIVKSSRRAGEGLNYSSTVTAAETLRSLTVF
jgi:hypothetical protein